MKYRYRVLALLFLLAIITYLDRVCISVAGPRIQEDLHISPEAWGWVVGVFVIAYGAFEIPTGYLGDRIGPRRVLTRIVLWWSVFTSLTGLASNYPLLLATRFCFGVGEAGAYPNSSVALSRWFPVTERARAWGVIWMASQIGGALSPLLVVPIQARYGWRASFYLFGILGVIWGAVWYRWYRDTPAEKPQVTQAELEEVSSLATTAGHRLPWKRVLRSKNLRAILLVGAAHGYGGYFFLSWLHTYLVKGRGFSEQGLMFSAFPFILGACANLCGGITSDALVKRVGLKWGRRAVGMIGLGSAALFTVAAMLSASGFWALTFLALSYAGITFNQPVLTVVCLDIAPRHAGAVTGAMNTIVQVGSFLSSVLFGYFVTATGSYDFPLVPMAITLVIGAALWLKIDPTKELIPEASSEQAAQAAPA
ncbi:MAG TPA: MFS transporter [Blastocatellia bacterium]|nr:MFS transporter [Blastocatellia bacterium]